MLSTTELKTKEEKDAELDRRIEALKKKNEALVKRYQEIEEDKKRAEQEGIAITTPRKPRAHEPAEPGDRRRAEKENFSITVDVSKSPAGGDKRIVDDWKPSAPRGRRTSEEGDVPRGPADNRSPPRRTGSGRMAWGATPRGGGGGGGVRQERRTREPRTPRDGEPGEAGGRRGGRRGRGEGGGGGGGGSGPGRGRGGGGRGGGGDADAEGTPGGGDRKSKEWEEKRRQNIEKMNEEMEKIAEYERGQRADGDKPLRNFLDDPRRSGPVVDADRKEGSRRHVRNWGGLDFDNVKTGGELEKEWTSRRPGPKGSTDMTMSMTGRERAEYLRWKKERQEIDEERLARHRNATGQWRREWDMQKTDNMFKEEANVAVDGGALEQSGSRRARGRSFGSEPRGRASDDGKRPPKGSTFGDFLSQGRSQGPRGERNRGKGRGGKPSYSMHDNRWEGEKEDEEKEKKDQSKPEKDASVPEPERKAEEMEDKEEPAEEEEQDDDQWEDASEGDEELSGEDCKKDDGREEVREDGRSPIRSPREKRTPRPRLRIPSPRVVAQNPPPAGKPISPFQLPEGHRPVSDWGEEMEMISPRSSVGGDSPPKPPSAVSSPPQRNEQEETGQPDKPDAVHSVTPPVSPPPGETEVVASEADSLPTDTSMATEADSLPTNMSMETESERAPSDSPDVSEREQGEAESPSPATPTVLVSEPADEGSPIEAERETADNDQNNYDASDAKSDDGKSDDGKSDDGKSDDGKSDDGKSDDGKSDDAKSDDAKSDDAKSDDPSDAKSDDPSDAKNDDLSDTKSDDAKSHDASDAKNDDLRDDVKSDDASDAKTDDATTPEMSSEQPISE
ncbi:coiled-coil domain-containing protein 9 isoform X2 [Stigmatopora argus]